MKKKIIIISLLIFNYLHAANTNNKHDTVNFKNRELNYENLNLYLTIKIGKEKDYVLRQVILETGWLTSTVSKTHNNLLGLCNLKGYYKFNHWTESVDLYKERISKHYKGGDYYLFLDKFGYAEDKDYIKKLKNINLNKVFKKK